MAGAGSAVSAGPPPLRHLAVIMDGNRRWARSRGLPSLAGHRAGAENVRVLVRACRELGISVLTLFAFSTENWSRSQLEINVLMNLLRRLLRVELEAFCADNIQVRVIGDISRFPKDIREQMRLVEERTAERQGMKLRLAAGYGGRWDLVSAAQKIAGEIAAGRMLPEAVNEKSITERLSLADVGAPDLCIRTGGEQRLSNFLLWDLAYAELYFARQHWPEFGPAALQEALCAYAQRTRRYGGA